MFKLEQRGEVGNVNRSQRMWDFSNQDKKVDGILVSQDNLGF